MNWQRFGQIKELQKHFSSREELEACIINENIEISTENDILIEAVDRYVSEFIQSDDFSLSYIEWLLQKLQLYKWIQVQTNISLHKMLVNIIFNTVLLPDYLWANPEKNYREVKKIIESYLKTFEKSIEKDIVWYTLELWNAWELSQEISKNKEKWIFPIFSRNFLIGEWFGRNLFTYNENKWRYEGRIPISVTSKFNKQKRKLSEEKLISFITEKLQEFVSLYGNKWFSFNIQKEDDPDKFYTEREEELFLSIYFWKQIDIINGNEILNYIIHLLEINNFLINEIATHFGITLDKSIKLFSNGQVVWIDTGEKNTQQQESFLDTFKIENSQKITLNDVWWQEEAKKQIEEVIDMIKREDIFKKYGARFTKWIIFEGPPWTGKTLLAKVIAYQVDAEVYSINFSDIQSSALLNDGANNIKKLFKSIRERQEITDKKIIIILDVQTKQVM